MKFKKEEGNPRSECLLQFLYRSKDGTIIKVKNGLLNCFYQFSTCFKLRSLLSFDFDSLTCSWVAT